MKRKILILALALACVLTLSACGCKHETWLDADCVTPKTCADCGETEGTPLGHSWLAATCLTPKTCEVCGETDGEALGHSWTDADCENPKTCQSCGETEGEALGHDWQDATTEQPKTCLTCGATEGDRIVTDERFTTENNADLFGTWSCKFPMTGETMGLEGVDVQLDCLLYLDLANDGSMTMRFAPADEEEFTQFMVQYVADALYAELAASGMDQAAADAAMKEVYGMGVQEYAQEAMQTMGLSSIFDAMAFNAVYYAEDGYLYIGVSWDASMEGSEYTLEGDTLRIAGDLTGAGGEYTELTRVTE